MGEIMKKVIGWIIIIILSVCSFMIVKEKTEIYNIGNENDNAEFKIKYKGLKGAVDFTSINDKIYIAFPHMIKCIENGKEPYTVLNDENLNIECAEPVGESLYFISNSKLMSYDINNKNVKEHIANLPNTGDYKNILLKSYDDKLFITIGAMTNSGVVGDDNTWISENKDNHDLTPETIKVNENSKGAFVKKGEANTSNQTIKASEIGNSSVVIFNTSTGDFETYAWGIRNINGIDITDDGKIYATVGGYEPRGDRPVYNDSDYIYEIKKDHWYGFPDYSGRGAGSGWGKTAGKGQKGQNSRSGGGVRPGFEGGQMPLYRRLPKRGFTNIFAKEYTCINVDRLNIFEDGTEVTPELLREMGMAKRVNDGIKILGNGNIEKKLTVKANKISKAAAEKIEAAGGKVEVI